MNDLVEMGYTAMIVSHKTGAKPDLIFQEQIRQLVDAVTYLLKEVGVQRVHLFGISMGASNAISAAAVDDRISSVAASSGISDCRLWLKQRLEKDFDRVVEEATEIEVSGIKSGSVPGKLFVTTDLLRIVTVGGKPPKVKGRITEVSARTVRSLLTYRPILGVPGIANKPAFFFHGTKDQLVSHEHTLAMYAATRTKKFKLLVEGGDHGMILDASIRRRILGVYFRELKKSRLLEDGPN
jgi:fermentation-respiration switch protein FrsA (DUF1100 family)